MNDSPAALDRPAAERRLAMTVGVFGRWTYVAIMAFYLVVYSPVLFVSYAFGDDYPILAATLQHKLTLIVESIVWEGRPLYALFVKLAFGAAGSVSDLGWIRAFGVAGIGVVSAIAYHALSKTALPRAVCLSAALLFGLTPPFQIYAAWAETSVFAWGAVLAGAAFLLCDGAGDSRTGWVRWCGAVVLLTSALAVYQPAAMVFWNFAAIAWLLRPAMPSARAILTAGAVMLSSMAAEYCLVKFGLLAVYGATMTNPRASLVQNYVGKAAWFVREPLRAASNVFSIDPSVGMSLSVTVFIIVGLFLYHGRDRRRTLIGLGLAVALLPACYVPNLLVAEDWASYRTQAALTGLIFILLVAAFVGWLRLLRAQRLTPALCAVAVLAGALAASRNVTAEFAVPQSVEYRLVESALLKMNFEENDRICLDLARWQESFAPIVAYDEFGMVSASLPWNPMPMAWLIMNAHDPAYAALFAEKAMTFQEAIDAPDYPAVFADCKEINLERILWHGATSAAP